jgi:hypothetical protein
MFLTRFCRRHCLRDAASGQLPWSAVEAQNGMVMPRKSHKLESVSLHNNQPVHLELGASTHRITINNSVQERNRIPQQKVPV